MRLHHATLALVCAALLALVACSRPSPTDGATLHAYEVQIELLAHKLPAFCDDATYSPINADWLAREIGRHVAATWNQRPYQPEAKDCDDFTDYLVAVLRHRYGEAAPEGAGGALIGRLNVQTPDGLHRVALVRTPDGWHVIDPTAGIDPKSRTLPVCPLLHYLHRPVLAYF